MSFSFLYIFHTHYDLRSGPRGPITPGGNLLRATENGFWFFLFGSSWSNHMTIVKYSTVANNMKSALLFLVTLGQKKKKTILAILLFFNNITPTAIFVTIVWSVYTIQVRPVDRALTNDFVNNNKYLYICNHIMLFVYSNHTCWWIFISIIDILVPSFYPNQTSGCSETTYSYYNYRSVSKLLMQYILTRETTLTYSIFIKFKF